MEGRNLPVMDPTGKSDPYCLVSVGNQEQRTSVQYNTICPTWNETLQFDISGVPQLMQNEPGRRNVLQYTTYQDYIMPALVHIQFVLIFFLSLHV